jgi:hypothetical protein
MGLFLGIASGAIKIGQKIFGKIKEKREAKVEKKAAALVAAQNKAAASDDKIASILGTLGGSQAVSSSGNALAGLKALITGAAPVAAVNPQPATTPNFYPEMGSLAGNGVRASKASYQEVRDQREGGGSGGNNKMLLIIGGAALVLLLIFKKR